ncbi:unnamed protein product, partial [Meganyctiphanes norvegica]
MVLTLMENTTPLDSCKINYDVEVRKCPALAMPTYAEVSCTAGRAWGSRCHWTCQEGTTLHGHHTTTCTGHRHPKWSHPTPTCKVSLGGCVEPSEVPNGLITCKEPQDNPGYIRPPRKEQYLHPAQTLCTLRCDVGYVVAMSQQASTNLTCQSNGSWDMVAPPCLPREPPTVDECEDHIIDLAPGQVLHLPLPTFTTLSGAPPEVECDIDRVSTPGTYMRTCKALDPELETMAYCKYHLHVTGSVVKNKETPNQEESFPSNDVNR